MSAVLCSWHDCGPPPLKFGFGKPDTPFFCFSSAFSNDVCCLWGIRIYLFLDRGGQGEREEDGVGVIGGKHRMAWEGTADMRRQRERR